MNALMTKPAATLRGRAETEPETPSVDPAALVDALVDALLSVLVFRNPADEGVSLLHRSAVASPEPDGTHAAGLRTCHLFETACYLIAALDSWHAERGLERLRSEVFRAVVVPRLFALFDLPGRVTNLEEVVVSRMEVYRSLPATSPAEARCFFMQAFLSSALEGGPRIESWIPDYALIQENLVLALAALSDLAVFVTSRLPLCFGAIESFYRLSSSTSR